MFAAAFCACSSPVLARQCTVAPRAVWLGDTIRVQCTGTVATARLGARTIKLFEQSKGGVLGLVPVAVTDSPGAVPIDILDADGNVVQSIAITIRRTRFPSQNVVLEPAIANLRNSPEEMQTLVVFRDTVSDQRFWEDPEDAPVNGCVTSPFGVKRLHNGQQTGEFHNGIDQRAAAGTPVHAFASGVVKLAQPFTVLGGTVGIDHGQGLETIYLHMSKTNVKVGDIVDRGDILGEVGSTGRSNGPHVHWVVYVNGVPVNPAQWVNVTACLAVKANKQRK